MSYTHKSPSLCVFESSITVYLSMNESTCKLKNRNFCFYHKNNTYNTLFKKTFSQKKVPSKLFSCHSLCIYFNLLQIVPDFSARRIIIFSLLTISDNLFVKEGRWKKKNPREKNFKQTCAQSLLRLSKLAKI